jgi:hypothetical protein
MVREPRRPGGRPSATLQNEVTPPDIPAPAQPMHGAEFPHFVWQQLGDIQAKLGELGTKLDANAESIKGVKSKVDDLVAWKHKILGGAAMLGFVVAALGWLAGKASNYIEFRSPTAQSAPAIPSVPPIQPMQSATPPTTSNSK